MTPESTGGDSPIHTLTSLFEDSSSKRPKLADVRESTVTKVYQHDKSKRKLRSKIKMAKNHETNEVKSSKSRGKQESITKYLKSKHLVG